MNPSRNLLHLGEHRANHDLLVSGQRVRSGKGRDKRGGFRGGSRRQPLHTASSANRRGGMNVNARSDAVRIVSRTDCVDTGTCCASAFGTTIDTSRAGCPIGLRRARCPTAGTNCSLASFADSRSCRISGD